MAESSISGAKPDTLLYRSEAGNLPVEIHEQCGLRWLTIGGEAMQSALRIAAVDELVLANQRYMLVASTLCPWPPRVLNLGFGGGAFERFFSRRWPAAKVTSVEVNPLLVDLARRYFELPAGWPVAIQPAHDYLRASSVKFDLILCDIFDGEAHPTCLFDDTFHAELARNLAPSGSVAINLSPANDDELLRLLRAMRPHYGAILLATVVEHGNVVVLLSREAAPSNSVLQARARELFSLAAVDITPLIEQFQRVPPAANARAKQ